MIRQARFLRTCIDATRAPLPQRHCLATVRSFQRHPINRRIIFTLPVRNHLTPCSVHTFRDTAFDEEHEYEHYDMADARSNASTTSTGKRKRSTQVAFYAVKVGRTPGVYQTWDEARQQVEGFPNPVFKKFGTYTEAENMVKGSSSSASKGGKTKYYGVAVGHVPGVYTDYASVLAQTKGCVGAKQKAFTSKTEAEAYVNQFKRNGSTPISLRGDLSETSSQAAGKANVPNKKQKKENQAPNGDISYEPGTAPLPPDAEDNFDHRIKLDVENGNIRNKTADELNQTVIQATWDFSGPVVVYTDGSSLGNGKVGAVGGVGVYFGPRDPRNVSEPLRGKRQTNQRAELVAIARALDHIPIDREALVITDSNYSIKCLTEWFIKWEQKGWKNSAGKDVENKDLIEPILARIRERELCKAKTRFQWIKGHANDPGNMAADELAVAGSRSSTPDLRNIVEFSETLNTLNRSRHSSSNSLNRSRHTSSVTPQAQATVPKTEPDLNFDAGDESIVYEKIFADLAAEQGENANQRQPTSKQAANADVFDV